MSSADTAFISTCRDILDHGSWVKDERVRPHWEDGEPAYTIKRFGVVNRYDLSEEFPLLTLRPIGLKSAIDEILWIWQKKSNNIHDLLSERHTDIKWGSSTSTKRGNLTWSTGCCTT